MLERYLPPDTAESIESVDQLISLIKTEARSGL